MRDAAAALDGIASVPLGAGRLAILQGALARFHDAHRTLDKAEGPTADRLRSFTQAMIQLAEEEVTSMQESVTLVVSVDPVDVPLKTISEVQLRLANSSAVPLRHLAIETRPAVGTGDIPYLAEGEACNVPLTVHPPQIRPFNIAVLWQAHRLDGVPVRGEAEVSLSVSHLERAMTSQSKELGNSPYIAGRPVDVDRQEMFFGRDAIMERIKRRLGPNTDANVILLEGNRRTGKSSILKQLKNEEVLSGWLPVFCDLQAAEGHNKGGIPAHQLFQAARLRNGKDPSTRLVLRLGSPT